MSNANTLILIDGSAYLYRAYHALPPLTTPEGLPTGALYGMTQMLKSVLKRYQPHYAAVIFDAKGPTFRTRLYADYKANRAAMADDLVQQLPKIYELVQALGFPLLMETEVEADDVIATLAKQAEAQGMHTFILSGDKDFAQLVNAQITLIDTLTMIQFDEAAIQAKFGIPPALIVDYLALIGDNVDNIPGVNKVGPKTAVKWLTQYGSLAHLIAHAEDISGKVGEHLRAALPWLQHTAPALLTLRTQVPLAYTPQQLTLKPPQIEDLRRLYKQLAFKQWLKDLPPPQQTTPQHPYSLILTQTEFEHWLRQLQQAPLFAFDTETTGLDYLTAQIVGVSFALGPEQAAYVPLAHDYPGAPEQLSREQVLKALKPLLEAAQPSKIGQNLKYDQHILANHGIQLQGGIYDTMLESYVLNSTATAHDMDSLALKYLDKQTTSFEDIAGKGKKQLTFNQIEIAQAGAYAAEDADITWQLHEQLWPRLQAQPGLKQVFTTIEMPLVPVLARMERHGVCIDKAHLQTQSQHLAQQLAELAQQIYHQAGESFNLNSPKQLQQILFHKLKLPVFKKTPKGEPSTAVEVLEALAQQYTLPQLILDYRSLSKLKSTYTDTLPQQIHPHTGRLHTSYHQAVTATGRLSSSQPNLQNIPIRSAAGRRIRQAFVAPQGYRVLAADYSQIELRLMAHLSQDEKLLAAFAAGEDIHHATAAEVFAVDSVTPEQRRRAKAINFGLIYGMQAYGLAKQLGIETQEAQSYIDTYFQRYTQVKAYMEQTRALAKQQGYVETLLGRRLYIADIHSAHPQKRQYAERSAINAPLQGSAADVIKLAMIQVDQWIENNKLDIKMTMQVHDELVFEVHHTQVEAAIEVISRLMKEVVSLRVALGVNSAVGDNWEQAHA